MGIFKFFRELVGSEEDETPGDKYILQELRGDAAQAQQELSDEQLAVLDAQLNTFVQKHSPRDCFSLVADYLKDGKFASAIYLYQKLGVAFPELRQDCEAQIGQSYYCLGKYAKAIEAYIAARVHGADPEWMDETIWEACETLSAEASDPNKRRESLQMYLTLCPQGQHLQDAEQALSQLQQQV
ncbi:MAG: tetratricopeptide repeat protein [Bacteroidota bacterium]